MLETICNFAGLVPLITIGVILGYTMIKSNRLETVRSTVRSAIGFLDRAAGQYRTQNQNAICKITKVEIVGAKFHVFFNVHDSTDEISTLLADHYFIYECSFLSKKARAMVLAELNAFIVH